MKKNASGKWQKRGLWIHPSIAGALFIYTIKLFEVHQTNFHFMYDKSLSTLPMASTGLLIAYHS